VIVRDIYVQGANPDGIAVRRSHHVWIDHVDLSNSLDGNLDITNEADFVTVSWSRFYYTDAITNSDHRFSNLIGSSDNAIADAGKLRITMHHNWWADNVHERMPRARFGKIHVFNNYYSSHNNNYCIRAGLESDLLIESNFFNRVGTPFEIVDANSLAHAGNVYLDAKPGPRLGTAFEPDYEYEVDPARHVAELVMLGSGPGRSASLDDLDIEEDTP
jgi:pectate lyase